MDEGHYQAAVGAHYGQGDLGERLLQALRAAGKDVDHLAPQDLAPVDQFHIGGREATLRLARAAGIGPAMHVLDVGGGLGGPARTLASQLGCRVTVLDLTAEFCTVGAMLTERTGLAGRVDFRHGDALALPFPEATFDAVWTQHAAMNIEDKDRLYASLARVLRPGGRLALHDIVTGPVQPLHFPVPWARTPELSFVATPEGLRAALARAGLRELSWSDDTAAALAFFRRWAAGPPREAHALGLHLVLGDAMREMGRNQVRNFEEARLAVVQAVLEK